MIHIKKNSCINNFFGAFLLFLAWSAGLQAEPLKVIATTEDLKYIAEQVAGSRAEVTSLLKGTQDPHFASPRPDFILKLNRADALILIGLDMEAGWIPSLIRQSRNPAVQPGRDGYCDASKNVKILGVPDSLSRLAGHIHAKGNPHYLTDPVNAVIAARNIKDTLIQIDPSGIEFYEKNFKEFSEKVKSLTLSLKRELSELNGLKTAVFHSEFIYLAHRYGFTIDAVLEEKPGIPPSAAYLKKVIGKIKRNRIKMILISPYNRTEYAIKASEETGASVVQMPISVGSEPNIKSYEDSQKEMIRRIIQAARK